MAKEAAVAQVSQNETFDQWRIKTNLNITKGNNQENKLGDLAFFGKSPKKITHVGILIDNTKIVHAYGVVRIDKFTSEGIYNNEEKRITHILQKVKRVN